MDPFTFLSGFYGFHDDFIRFVWILLGFYGFQDDFIRLIKFREYLLMHGELLVDSMNQYFVSIHGVCPSSINIE